METGRLKMNEIQTEYKRQQTLLVEQLCRINQKESRYNYGLAGRLMKHFSFDLLIRILSHMREGTPIAYIQGALRREQERTTDFVRLNGLGAIWKA